ncbi:MAG: DUF1402 family protein [Bauldia sp.]
MQRSSRSPAPFLCAALIALALVGAAGSAAADDAPRKLIADPPGNRSAVQPDISYSSIARTAETGGDFASKYKEVYGELAGDGDLLGKIVKTAAAYGIDPIHLLGAIVGEHTYNVDVFDNLQGYYVKALAYLNNNALKFQYNGEPVAAFVTRPQFAACASSTNDYELWTCRDQVWRDDFRNKTVAGESFPDDRFERVFFQPFYAGQTFGLGQLSPLAALSVSDLVSRVGGLPALDVDRAPEVYRAVMDPDMTLNYMAALIVREIDAYRSIAGIDISNNPGITATLYNTGDAVDRAAALAAENRKRRAAGQAPLLPKENYYGWLINDRLAELRKLLPGEPVTPVADKPAAAKP